MFNGQTNSREQRQTVNTRGLQLYNSEGFDPSTLVLDFWDNAMFSIKLHPAKEKAKQTDREKFDYDQVVNTALSITKAAELLAHVPELVAAHEAGEEISRYVDISGVNLLGIGTKVIDGNCVYFFAIHKQLNDNRIPQASMYYEFLPSECIANYDPKTGEFEKMNKGGKGEFELFIRYLDNGINALTKAYAHSIRVVDQFFRKRLEDKVDSTMVATGAQNNYANNGGGRRNNGGGNSSLFNEPSGRSAPSAAQETISGDNLDEELPF